ncbi:hypothetical protein F5I97DRAFT_683299 [Phlebopus sp. FC_14]|nr:hypothetical protein F5I97DRAFT_683299 [Phlebopus sp. FC_14]
MSPRPLRVILAVRSNSFQCLPCSLSDPGGLDLSVSSSAVCHDGRTIRLWMDPYLSLCLLASRFCFVDRKQVYPVRRMSSTHHDENSQTWRNYQPQLDGRYNLGSLPSPINGSLSASVVSTDPSRQERFHETEWSGYHAFSTYSGAPGSFVYGHERAGNVSLKGRPFLASETEPHGSGIAPRLNAETSSYPVQPPQTSALSDQNFSYASHPLQRPGRGPFSRGSASAYAVRWNPPVRDANYPPAQSFAVPTNTVPSHSGFVPQSLGRDDWHWEGVQPALPPDFADLNAHVNGIPSQAAVEFSLQGALRAQTKETLPAVQPSAFVPIINHTNISKVCADAVPSPPSPSTTQFPCIWSSDHYRRCDAWINGDQRSVTLHLRERHHFTGDCETKQCLWGDCDVSMQGRNIPRHIVSCHLAVKAPCSFCGIPLSREDAKKKHGKACAAAREGGVLG